MRQNNSLLSCNDPLFRSTSIGIPIRVKSTTCTKDLMAAVGLMSSRRRGLDLALLTFDATAKREHAIKPSY